jgi:HSP20 family molecular chaperone IbpA
MFDFQQSLEADTCYLRSFYNMPDVIEHMHKYIKLTNGLPDQIIQEAQIIENGVQPAQFRLSPSFMKNKGTKSIFTVVCSVPGLPESQIQSEVTVLSDKKTRALIVSGRSEGMSSVCSNSESPTILYDSFEKWTVLPPNVDVESMEKIYNNGLLCVSFKIKAQ